MAFSSNSFALLSPRQFSISSPVFPNSADCFVPCSVPVTAAVGVPRAPARSSKGLIRRRCCCPDPPPCPDGLTSCPRGQADPHAVTDNWSVQGKTKRKLNSKQSPAHISSGPAALGKCSSVPCIIYLPSLQIPRSSAYNEQMQMWNDLWRGNLCLKRIRASTALTGVVGERQRAQERRWVGSVEDRIIFADQVSRGAECCSRVLRSVEALQGCPGGTASGYSFTRAPGMSRGCRARPRRAGLLPEAQISGRDKAESTRKDRQIGRCCGGRTPCVVPGS